MRRFRFYVIGNTNISKKFKMIANWDGMYIPYTNNLKKTELLLSVKENVKFDLNV
jgi:hypothetical protein